MSLLPRNIRLHLFDSLSRKTLRCVDTVPRAEATGLVATVYAQIEQDFFINGSLTSRSRVPELLAAIWAAGRETILVDDRLDRTTKEAMAATLSTVNDCPYCGDMLVSLVHAGKQKDAAMRIFQCQEEQIEDGLLQERLAWVKAVGTPGATAPERVPFTNEQLPEALGSLMAMGDINRFSHVVMAGSPVSAPFGLAAIKAWALRRFGDELAATHRHPLTPGSAAALLPKATLPEDMQWATPNPRIARTLTGWHAVIENEAAPQVPDAVRQRVMQQLKAWDGNAMPMSRSWVEDETAGLADDTRTLAKFALLLAKAPYQLDEALIWQTRYRFKHQEAFIRALAWCSYTASRFVTARIAKSLCGASVTLGAAA
ncbi:hypothetical protein [Motiliproteus sp. SC1-56]|uniref:hypothetical protein n=1 Tax=Motiliproteus sp. SC1-56 TaxID=2799565 RepID=UPI001A8F9FB2|nr:hypothetical protein [Motiliproteus sp. SC1-56]